MPEMPEITERERTLIVEALEHYHWDLVEARQAEGDRELAVEIKAIMDKFEEAK